MRMHPSCGPDPICPITMSPHYALHPVPRTLGAPLEACSSSELEQWNRVGNEVIETDSIAVVMPKLTKLVRLQPCVTLDSDPNSPLLQSGFGSFC